MWFIEKVNVAGDDGNELHTADGVFRATSDDDDSLCFQCQDTLLLSWVDFWLLQKKVLYG